MAEMIVDPAGAEPGGENTHGGEHEEGVGMRQAPFPAEQGQVNDDGAEDESGGCSDEAGRERLQVKALWYRVRVLRAAAGADGAVGLYLD